MKITLMNAPIMTGGEGTYHMKKISTEAAKAHCDLAESVESAVGHSGAAKLFSHILDREVKVNRINHTQEDDTVISLKLLTRMPEGCGDIDEEKMKSIGYELYLIKKNCNGPLDHYIKKWKEQIEVDKDKQELIEALIEIRDKIKKIETWKK